MFGTTQGLKTHNIQTQDEEAEKELEIQSRKGYLLKDLARNFNNTLSELGHISSGKLIHYTADMICSGGLQLWQKLCWDYAYDHIGVASPRVFLYLNKKFKELNEEMSKCTFEKFCATEKIQKTLAEIVIILQNCPKKSKPKIPYVPPETHENPQWLKTVLRSTNKMAVLKVYTRSSDLDQMLHAGNEMVFAITEGATERAIYWAKWLCEEDNIIRKKHNSGLSTQERGPPNLPHKQKTSAGYYIINILAEVYKEFATNKMIRMHEEFQGLLDIYRSIDFKLSSRRKIDTIAIMIQLLTDVPKWKVPAAPPLIQDEQTLQRFVDQSPVFFKEILTLPLPEKPLPKTVTKLNVKKEKKPDKQSVLEYQLSLTDKAIMGFYGF